VNHGTIQGGDDAKSRIVILSSRSLFSEGVRQLLCRAQGLDVVAVDATPAAVQHIGELKPDIVILDSADPKCDPTPILTQILHAKVDATLVGLNLADNVACTLCVHHRIVRDVSDLLDIVESVSSAGRV